MKNAAGLSSMASIVDLEPSTAREYLRILQIVNVSAPKGQLRQVQYTQMQGRGRRSGGGEHGRSQFRDSSP